VTRVLLAFATAASLAWAVSIVVAPALLRSPSAVGRAAAVAPYVIGSRVCHQSAARSFTIAGAPLPVCARCTGIYAGVPFGVVAGLVSARVRPAGPRRARRVLAWAAVPTILTVVIERAGAPVPGWLRAVCGALLAGVAAKVITFQLCAEDRAGR
jgi:uncharacterized membrane protein